MTNNKDGKSPFDAAFEKGQKAFHSGLSIDACPYKDKKQDSGKLTFSRAFRKQWFAGYYIEKEKAGR
ncbi:MAG: hypothetical protein PHX51_08630 [Clostridia bacterium]|nr:hypothetical protein [Clostridia bacterium]